MAYGYHKKHREEFEHCIIESIVTEQYKMALYYANNKVSPLLFIFVEDIK